MNRFVHLEDRRGYMDYTYRLLAVDDETDILRTNRKYLEARGYQVDSAVCASEALELLRKQKYDCILLDVLLPDMNGFEPVSYTHLTLPTN